jgi:hypothetical protein
MDIPLTHGSLLIMGNNSQTHWLHALLADEACVSDRINLTFRFYARQSTKHIEGMEHNHEWEAAPDSTRVLLHRTGFGRPVHVDLPKHLEAYQLSRYLSSVLPGFRGPAKVSIKSPQGSWNEVPQNAVIAIELGKNGGANQMPEINVAPVRTQNVAGPAAGFGSNSNNDRSSHWQEKPKGGRGKGGKGYGKGRRS